MGRVSRIGSRAAVDAERGIFAAHRELAAGNPDHAFGRRAWRLGRIRNGRQKTGFRSAIGQHAVQLLAAAGRRLRDPLPHGVSPRAEHPAQGQREEPYQRRGERSLRH